jgi:hypothetical protein
MSFPNFKQHKPQGKDITVGDIQVLQDNLSSTLSPITGRAHLESSILEGITLVSGSTNLVPHKLGRKISGWKLCDLNANAVIYRDSTSTADNTRFLALVTSLNCICSLEVW